MAKRLVVCCDGTWDSPDERSDGTPTPTNVTKIARALEKESADGHEQRMYYHLGVGTSRTQRLIGGGFGFGVSRAIRDTYAFLVDNYEPDDELYFFGFSRGAFTARSTAGFVRNCGILRRENAGMIKRAFALYRSRSSTSHPRGQEATLFRKTYSHQTDIHFIGVWDTVGALGIPWTGSLLADLVNRRCRFHDTNLSSTVHGAYQALAIDERREIFSPTLWTNVPAEQAVEQVWFTGVHRDVGGGYPRHELSDVTLLWMMDRARKSGLAFADLTDIQPTMRINPNALAPPHESRTGFYRIPAPLVRQLGATDPDHEWAASTAIEHYDAQFEYESPGLATYLDGPHQILDITL